MATDSAFQVEYAVTPRFDVFYALYTLTNAAPSPLDPWKERALLRLPRDFERVARRIAPVPLFWPLLADVAQGLNGEISFDELVSHIRKLPATAIASNVLSGIFRDRDAVQALVDRRKTLRQLLTDNQLPGGDLLAHFGLRPYSPKSPAANAIENLLGEPESFREELAMVLERFWQTLFRREWSALESALRADSFRMQDIQESSSLPDFAEAMHFPLQVDTNANELKSKGGQGIPFSRVDRCYVLPSAFNTRRWWAKYEVKGERLRLYFPVLSEPALANEIGAEDIRKERSPKPKQARDVNAEAVFRALGDATRYAIASILARTPMSSAELARKLGVSKPTITHHIQSMRSADLITEMADGGSTRLSLNSDTLRGLSDAAVVQLFSSTDDLQLATTRKRRK